VLRHKLVAAALLALFLVACSNSPGSSTGAPEPDEPLPGSPRALARSLTDGSRALRSAIEHWRATGDLRRSGPPEEVTLDALHQQRIYRLLAKRPHLARATLRRLPPGLRPEARDITTALRDLFRLSPPPRRRKFTTGRALPPGLLLDYYRRAQRRFRVSAPVLAAVNHVESGFNRLRNNSVAGAQGPMQFLPSTWRRYGLGGDVRDPHDAILGAANYLRRSGAPGSYRRALFAYNPSRLYVDAVLRFAHRMRGPGFLAIYSWQVFVRTPSGERRLTGP
jgi:membrane-bound lytic murein transglycosylase B